MNQLKLLTAFIALAMLLCSATGVQSQNITSPESHFGFRPGEDRKLFGYQSLIDYLNKLETESDRLQMLESGTSPMGKPMYVTFISSPENIARLEELREINRRLALEGDIPDAERAQLVRDGRVFILATMSMHSTEVGPSQAAPLMAYNLITGSDPDMHVWLEDVVFMMVPCHNPDGMDMIVDHYNKYLGTPYEGSSLPGVYHKYVGHNINRDFVTLTQKDNQMVADLYNLEWYPQVLVEKHQMGMTGPRYFVPPNHDPIAQVIDETLWNWSWVFGSNMSRDMTAKGLTGISQNYLFDDYWPGSTQTSTWKNIISLLTEAASVQLATPVFVEAAELSVSGKGLAEYKKGIRFPAPWPGGWWRLGDIVKYEEESMYSMIKTGSLFKRDILEWRNNMARSEIEKGRTEAPYHYILPRQQHDPGELYELVKLLERHGIAVYETTQELTLDNLRVPQGDLVIPMTQAFRPFIKELMQKQEFPVRRYTPGGEIIRPYDITSWSLPLHRGMEAIEMNRYFEALDASLAQTTAEALWGAVAMPEAEFLVFPASHNQSYKAAFKALAGGIEVQRSREAFLHQGQEVPAGSFLMAPARRQRQALEAIVTELAVAPLALDERPDAGFRSIRMPRIALVETNLHDMDAGWTRFLFDTYGIPYRVLRPDAMAANDLKRNFDVIVFPDANKNQLMQGRSEWGGQVFIPFYHPDYIKGMGREGWQKVLGFIQDGGKVVSWGRSVDLFSGLMEPGNDIPAFRFPVNNVTDQLTRQGLYVPGSFLRMQLLADHPLTLGMPAEIGIFQRTDPILSTSIPTFDMDRRVAGQFPEREILMSGYAEKEELLENRPALVWLKKGKGQVVLFSFVPNFRGSTPVSSKLIFNALLLE
jgi:hypothetical protein